MTRESYLAQFYGKSQNYTDIPNKWYKEYNVKKGLRNEDGTGVRVWLTRVADVVGYSEGADGQIVAIPGELYYRGYNVVDLVKGKLNSHFGYEEVCFLLLFGYLPKRKELDQFCAILRDCYEIPDEFVEMNLLRMPGKNLMNKLQDAVLTLYNYDDDPDNTDVYETLVKGINLVAKDEEKKDRLSTVLYNLTEAITIGASLLESFMPETSAKILAQLNTAKRSLDELQTFGLYPSGNQVTDKPEILFARMDVKEVLEKAEALQAAQAAEAAKESGADAENAEEEDGIDLEPKAEITYDDFAKLQFQVGEIIKCEAVPKSKKLLCSQVKIGTKTRQIISGIKAHYTPEEMVGKKVMVVTNLKPAKLAGMLSEGMILCAEDAEGNLALMTPEKKMPAGAEIC